MNDNLVMTTVEGSHRGGNGEKEYYETQFATLKSFDEVDRIVQANLTRDEEEEDEDQKQAKRARKISNYANFTLLAFTTIVVYLIFKFPT